MFDTEKPQILIVCASRHGHTHEIAQRVADTVEAAGAEPRLVDVDDAGELDPRDFDAVIVGGSIHMARHDDRLVDWARRHHAQLGMRPTGFFSVSLASAADSDDERQYIDRFVEDTDWTPDRCIAVAGALQYREYGFLTRQMVRQIAHKKGLSTDISRDTEYTDWAEVERFAATLAAAARPACDVRKSPLDRPASPATSSRSRSRSTTSSSSCSCSRPSASPRTSATGC